MGNWHHEVTGIQSLLEILSCRSDTLPTNGSSNKLDWPGQSLLCPPSAPGQWHPRPLGAVHGTLGPCLLPGSGAPSHSSELISVCHYLSVQGRRVAGKLPSPWSTPPAGFTHPLENAVRVWGGRHKKKKKKKLCCLRFLVWEQSTSCAGGTVSHGASFLLIPVLLCAPWCQ